MNPAAERIIGLYEDNAAAWDAGRGGPLFERDWVQLFEIEVTAGEAILDLGCGSGQPIARYFIERGAEIVGVDSSPSLIALCRDRFPDQTWICADMRGLALNRTFGGLIAWHSFFHLAPEDQRAMFAVFRDHVMPGGAVMFTSGTTHGEAIGEWQGEPLYHGSLDAAEYESLFNENGFAVMYPGVTDPECGHATIWLAHRR